MKVLVILFAFIAAISAMVKAYLSFVLLLNNYDVRLQTEDAVKDMKDRDDFIKKMTKECSKEVGLDFESGNKMLLGDLSNRSREAQV